MPPPRELSATHVSLPHSQEAAFHHLPEDLWWEPRAGPGGTCRHVLASSAGSQTSAKADYDFEPVMASAKQLPLVKMSFSFESQAFLGARCRFLTFTRISVFRRSASSDSPSIFEDMGTLLSAASPKLPFALLVDYERRETALDYFRSKKSQFNNSVRIQFPVKFRLNSSSY